MNIGILDSATLLVRPQGESAWVTVMDLDCQQDQNGYTVHLDARVYEILVRYSDYGFTDCMALKWSGPGTGGVQQPLDQELLPISDCFADATTSAQLPPTTTQTTTPPPTTPPPTTPPPTTPPTTTPPPPP